MRRRLILCGALLLAIAGCSENTSDLSVQVITAAPAVADWTGLTVDVSAPHLSRTFRRGDFEPEAGTTTQFRTNTVRTRGAGTALVDVRIPGSSSTLPARVQVSFLVEPDWGYGITIFIGGPRPSGFFCGQLGGAAQLRSAPPESLYVVYGGSPKGAVC